MKYSAKLFFLVILSVFLIFPLVSSSQIQSNPVVPSELLAHYEKDAYSLALNRIFEINSPATNEIVIPTSYVDTIWNALACVYNAFPIIERDTVFDILCIHNQQFYPDYFTSDIIVESNNFMHYMAWTQGSIVSGDIAIDTLLANYGFTIFSHFAYNGTVSAHFTTNEYINTHALVNIINSFPQILNSYAGAGYFGGPSRKIYYSKDEDFQYLDFRISWGDCLSGCTDHKYWHFRVNENYQVEYTGFSTTPPLNTYGPIYPYCNMSNPPLFSYSEIPLCIGDSVFANNQWYFYPIAFNDTVTSSLGTDSIIFYSIYDAAGTQVLINETVCEGEPYIIQGDTLYSPGTYNYLIPSTASCDSIITLNLNTSPSYELFDSMEMCDGETFDFYGQLIDTSGTYFHMTQTSYGCDSVVWMDVNFNSNPIIEFESWFEDTIYKDAGVIDLNMALPHGGVYSGLGVNQNTIDPMFIPTGSSWIYYSYTDSLTGCSNLDSIQIYIVEGNNIENFFIHSNINIFPNPSSGLIEVSISNKISLPVTMKLYNTAGNKIHEINISDVSVKLDLTGLPRGIYFIQILENELSKTRNYHTQKLILK